jgi:hypothetical protein
MTEYEHHPDVARKKLIYGYTIRFIAFIVIVAQFTILVLLVDNARTGREARNRLLDCTVPSGKCFQEGQKRTAQVLVQIDQQGKDREAITRATVIAAAACAKRWDAIVLIRQCVEKELENE